MAETIAIPPATVVGAHAVSSLLSVQHAEKVFGAKGNMTHALDGVSLNIAEGEFVAIMGPSGSGKTTLLNCISTIDRLTNGRILIKGRDITKLSTRALAKFRRDELGFIFQDCNLLDTLTAFENIALSLSILRTPAAQIRDRVEETAELLGIGDCLDKYPYQMSGGQQQRVAIARSLIYRPALLLADEPTGNLDRKNGDEIIDLLKLSNRNLEQTILLITHDEKIALEADRIITIEDGKIISDQKRR